jgi:hypothetical protein
MKRTFSVTFVPTSGHFCVSALRKNTVSTLPQNLVKPLRRGFLEYVVDSVGEINVAKVALLPFAG